MHGGIVDGGDHRHRRVGTILGGLQHRRRLITKRLGGQHYCLWIGGSDVHHFWGTSRKRDQSASIPRVEA
jgi:hypothetical protein